MHWRPATERLREETGAQGVAAHARLIRRAKIINAEGEFQAAQKLLDAAKILATQPQAMQLRYLTALHDIAGEKSSTIVFPLPLDILSAFLPVKGDADEAET